MGRRGVQLSAVGHSRGFSVCAARKIRIYSGEAKEDLGYILPSIVLLGGGAPGSTASYSRLLRAVLSHVLHDHAIDRPARRHDSASQTIRNHGGFSLRAAARVANGATPCAERLLPGDQPGEFLSSPAAVLQ